MENNETAADEALEVVEDSRRLNAARLQRPKRYWIMFAVLLSMLALVPYMSSWPPLLQYTVPVLLAIVVGLAAAWKQPVAVRKIRLSGRMLAQLLGFAIVAGVLAGVSAAVYAGRGWWWVPLVSAIVIFSIVATVGPTMDRSWARQVSGVRK